MEYPQAPWLQKHMLGGSGVGRGPITFILLLIFNNQN